MNFVKEGIKKFKQSSIGIKCMQVMIIIQFAFIAYVNITRIPITMDNDSAKLFLHIIEMCKNSTIFIPNWSNMTTLEIDCSAVLALPLYYITKNIYLSFGISNIIILFCYILVIGAILKDMNVKEYARLICYILFMIPFSFGQLLYFNMMFFAGGQYSIKVLVPLLMVYVMFGDNNRKGIKWYTVSAITCLLGFICGISSGPYVLVAGVFPVVLSFYVLLFTEGRRGYAVVCGETRNFDDDKQHGVIAVMLSRKSLFGIAMVISSLIGIAVCRIMDVNTSGLSMRNVVIDEFAKNVESLVTSFFEIMGATAYDDCNILSISGITYAIRFVFAIAAIVVMVISIRYMYRELMYNRKNNDSKRNSYICLTMIVVVNMFIVLVTGSGNEARYQLVSVFPLILLMSIWLSDHLGVQDETETGNVNNTYRKSNSVIIFLAFACFMMTILSDLQVIRDRSYPYTAAENIKSKELCMLLQGYDENTVIVFDDTAEAEILRMMDYESGKLYIAYKNETDEYSERGLGVHDYYTNIISDDLMSKAHLVIVNEYITDISQFEIMAGNVYERTGEYQNYKIYRSLVK